MGGNAMQKSAAAIDQRFELFSELAEGAEGTALEVRQGVRR
jgi:hypothetical protein